MFSVSPEIYKTLSLGSRYLFAFFALMILLFSVSWLYEERRKRRERLRSLPEVGTIGEMIVISGGDDLAQDTWFPVPREGVLGSVRSCDLVIPCPGVRSRHLDFSWQDGVGLLLRPRSGCQAFVNGTAMDRRTDPSVLPLVHGSYLQVGDAVLRLQLFSALNHTNLACTVPEQPVTPSGSDAEYPPVYPPVPPVQEPFTGAPYAPPSAPASPAAPVPESVPEDPGETPPQVLAADPAEQPRPQAPPRRRRVDRWKEDWSE